MTAALTTPSATAEALTKPRSGWASVGGEAPDSISAGTRGNRERVPAATASAVHRHGPAGAAIIRKSTRKRRDRKSTRLNSSHPSISYAVFCLKKKNNLTRNAK